MKVVLIAGLLCALASPALAQESVIAQLQSTEDRLKRIEAINEAQIAGFFVGGSLECGSEIPQERVADLIKGAEHDPELYAAFAQGAVTAALQNTFNIPTKNAFCKQLSAFRAENGL